METSDTTAGMATLFTGFMGVVLFVGAVILALMALLMPYYVYRISVETTRLRQMMEQWLRQNR